MSLACAVEGETLSLESTVCLLPAEISHTRSVSESDRNESGTGIIFPATAWKARSESDEVARGVSGQTSTMEEEDGSELRRDLRSEVSEVVERSACSSASPS